MSLLIPVHRYEIDGKTYAVRGRLKRKGWIWSRRGSVWTKTIRAYPPPNAHFARHYPGCRVSVDYPDGRGWTVIWVSPSHPINEPRRSAPTGTPHHDHETERRIQRQRVLAEKDDLTVAEKAELRVLSAQLTELFCPEYSLDQP